MEHYNNSEIIKATTPIITTTHNSIDIHKQQQRQYQQQPNLKKQQELLEGNQQHQKKEQQTEEKINGKHEHEEEERETEEEEYQQQQQQQQQFCLRWHNHQTSLLSTLPILLDQCQLTDVTISAEGRTLRAHRVVLSACSTFFLEIFRSLDTNNHPVIIIPGASFTAIVALLTFMYSGEVNVYEEQIPVLLSLAETLGIKGLTDVHNNDFRMEGSSLWQKNEIKVESNDSGSMENFSPPFNKIRKVTTGQAQQPQPEPQTQTQPQLQPESQLSTSLQLESQSQIHHSSSDTTSSLFQSLLNHKLATLSSSRSSTSSPVTSTSLMSTPLENFFLRSLQFYPNLLQQPLNFTQMALDKYQRQQYFLPMQTPITAATEEYSDECNLDGCSKQFSSNDDKKQQQHQQEQQQKQQPQKQQKDLKRLDKIADNLKDASNTMSSIMADNKKTATNVSTPIRNLHNTTSATSTANATSSPAATACTVTSIASSNINKSTSLCYTSNTQNRMSFPAFKNDIPLGYNASTSNEMGYRMESVHKIESSLLSVKDSRQALSGSQITPPAKPCSNSKLYATCFICHKQLSNQYNLRVHLETHQNVRYACNVCPHVSRSKDALRKHVSYRHPGVPSPCETETRRKRSNKLSNAIKTGLTTSSILATDNAPATSSNQNILAMSSQSAMHLPITTTPVGTETDTMSSVDAVTHLKSSAFMFLPNQYHLAVAAVASAASAAADQHKLSPFLIQKADTNTFEYKTSTSDEINQQQSTITSRRTPIHDAELTSSSVFELSKCLQNNNNNNYNNNDKDSNPKATTKLCDNSDCEKLVKDEVK